MKGCLQFIFGLILFCLLITVGAGIYGLFWANRHLYLDQPLAIQVSELDPGQKARLVKLFPLRQFFSENSSNQTAEIKLSPEEANWLANYILTRKQTPAQVWLKPGENRVTAKYSQKISSQKYLNIMLDAVLEMQNNNARVSLERLQVGDCLVPTTLLGQLNYLAELYLERGFRISGNGVINISRLELRDTRIRIVIHKP